MKLKDNGTDIDEAVKILKENNIRIGQINTVEFLGFQYGTQFLEKIYC